MKRCGRVFLWSMIVAGGLGDLGIAAPLAYTGVNLAGAEFGSAIPGAYNTDYTYPTQSEVDYFKRKGMNVIRLPFRWERLQQTTNAAFNAAELNRLHGFVSATTAKGMFVILDPHNYARYNNNVIGAHPSVLVGAFTNFWGRLASIYCTNDHVMFGLMNEPNSMSTELWRDDANAAIGAIRAAGATNLILVPGNAWTGAHSWFDSWYGTPNATVMLTITDPLNNYAIEAHQYLDADSSGTGSTCISPTIGVERLTNFTAWCRSNGRRAFLGEFAGAANLGCLQSLDNMVAYMEGNRDVWMGWTFWAAGPWWGEYMFTLEPSGTTDRPQMDVLESHIPIPVPLLLVAGGNKIQFTAVVGFNYQAERATNLINAVWTTHNAPIVGGGTSTQVNMSIGNSREFYRVRVTRTP